MGNTKSQLNNVSQRGSQGRIIIETPPDLSDRLDSSSLPETNLKGKGGFIDVSMRGEAILKDIVHTQQLPSREVSFDLSVGAKSSEFRDIGTSSSCLEENTSTSSFTSLSKDSSHSGPAVLLSEASLKPSVGSITQTTTGVEGRHSAPNILSATGRETALWLPRGLPLDSVSEMEGSRTLGLDENPVTSLSIASASGFRGPQYSVNPDQPDEALFEILFSTPMPVSDSKMVSMPENDEEYWGTLYFLGLEAARDLIRKRKQEEEKKLQKK